MCEAQETTASCAASGLGEGLKDALDVAVSECFIYSTESVSLWM